MEIKDGLDNHPKPSKEDRATQRIQLIKNKLATSNTVNLTSFAQQTSSHDQ